MVGVDIASEFTATARMLVAREKRLRSPVRIETGDATQFEVPDRMAHAYVFNPFQGDLFARVVANMIESLDRAPRHLRLIYVQPEEHERLIATGRFRPERVIKTPRLNAIWVGIYTAR